MLKLIKYEFRKQFFSKIILLTLLALIELAFFLAIGLDRGFMLGITLGLLLLFTAGTFFFLAIEAIMTYDNDLKQKQSYMLFLTPNTTYSIVGAKVIAAAIQIILAGIAFIFVYAIDGGTILAKYSSIAEVKKLFEMTLDQIFGYNIEPSHMIISVAIIASNWLCIVTTAFLSITLSTTFLADKKFKGFVSFIIFLLINYIFNKITYLTLGPIDITNISNLRLILNVLHSICYTIITFIATGWMLDKKVSV